MNRLTLAWYHIVLLKDKMNAYELEKIVQPNDKQRVLAWNKRNE